MIRSPARRARTQSPEPAPDPFAADTQAIARAVDEIDATRVGAKRRALIRCGVVALIGLAGAFWGFDNDYTIVGIGSLIAIALWLYFSTEQRSPGASEAAFSGGLTE